MKKLEENKKEIIKISIYLIIIIIIIIFARLSNNKPNEEQKENIEVSNILKNIEENHYKANIHIILDDDALTLEYERINEFEIGKKK